MEDEAHLHHRTAATFTGSAWGLFGQWIKWFLLAIITLGIYGFWVYPRLTRWIVEHQELAATV